MNENEFQDSSFGEIIDLIKQYEESVKLQQPVFLEEENYERIIQFYQDNREVNKALRVIDSAIEQYSFSSYFYVKKAELLANAKRFEEAEEMLDAAERLDPNDVNIFLIRADVYLWEGRHSEAMDQITHALEFASEPEDICELYLELADIYEDQERYDDAIEALKQGLMKDPRNEEGLNRLWFSFELIAGYDQSIAFHKSLIDKDPYSYLAWFNLGHAYAGKEDYENALDALEYVVAINETFEPAYVCSGDIKYDIGQYEESLAFYFEAIKHSKPNKEIYLKLAETYEKLEDYAKARSFLRKAIAIDPYYDEAFFKIGETYRAEEKWSKAVASFERAAKLNKDNPLYLLALADSYLSIDECDKAVELFERIFQMDPLSKQNWINLSTAYFNVDNFRKAFQVLNEAEEKFEDNADLFYIKAVFYFQIGNRHEGLINLERGLLIDFNLHTMIFEMDDTLLSDEMVLQVIEQYREEED